MTENTNTNKIQERLKRLESIFVDLKKMETPENKLQLLDRLPEISAFISSHRIFSSFFEKLGWQDQTVLKLLIVIGQEHVLVNLASQKKALNALLRLIKQIDEFYETSNGLIVYQMTVLKLILENKEEFSLMPQNLNTSYLKPPKIDISEDTSDVRKAIRTAIDNLGDIAEIYPIGGAGERLKLTDNQTNEPLPVALLPFLGKNLLEGLIRDVQAREFLYFKLTGKQLITPIAMMTSDENHNNVHIHKLLEDSNWFYRSKEQFFIFTQPMVPVVTEEGNWLLSSLDSVHVKPSGHGVIWKLSQEKGVFKWLKLKNRSKMITRQINNPVACIDAGLLSFMGVGFRHKKVFGFASCDRFVHTSEGMDILIEEKTHAGYAYKLTNIEYTEFVKKGIEDEPEVEFSKFSKFPANTNLLFLDIEEVEKAIQINPVPGLLINMKSSVPYINSKGLLTGIKAGRLESTMQNIADEIVDLSNQKLDENQYDTLRSYLTYNKRIKTISVTKRSFNTECCQAETPESCFYDILQNHHDLFTKYCFMNLPDLNSFEHYLVDGPSFVVNYHPACGPLFSVIAQKIRGGRLADGSELQLEIAEIDMENLELDGSLIIEATNVMGSSDEAGILQYGKQLGKCTLKNVKVKNKGIDREVNNTYWKQDVKRHESLKIILHGDAELVAENVIFTDDLQIDVQDGQRLVVSQVGEDLKFDKQPLQRGTSYWTYAFDNEDRIVLRRDS
jgi:hypothetical protein